MAAARHGQPTPPIQLRRRGVMADTQSSSTTLRCTVGSIAVFGLASQLGLLGLLFEYPSSLLSSSFYTSHGILSAPRQQSHNDLHENVWLVGLAVRDDKRENVPPIERRSALSSMHFSSAPTIAENLGTTDEQSSLGKNTVVLREDRTSNDQSYRHLPKWIQEYLAWHASVRLQFPGNGLWDDPRAPNLLVRTCLGSCGGLNDRLGQLPWDVYLASRTRRILLLHWHRPVPVSHFLHPNVVDWTVPSNVPGFEPLRPAVSGGGGNGTVREPFTYTRDHMRSARAYRDLFEGYASDRPDDTFWTQHVDQALHRATSGEFRDDKLLRVFLLGHVAEDRLEDRLRQQARLLEDGAEVEARVHWDTPAFGALFRSFFRPSPGVEKALVTARGELGLIPGRYSAVHCRVRHPKASSGGGAFGTVLVSKDPSHTADKSGLQWTGQSRIFAIRTAARAVRCARTLTIASADSNKEGEEPLYFFSDSIDLVRYVSSEVLSEHPVGAEPAAIADLKDDVADVEESRRRAFRGVRVVSLLGSNASSLSRHYASNDKRDDVAHLDKNKGRPPEDYYPTFVDFFLATEARCVTFGVGFYAMFAAKVSGTPCRLLYEQEAWGSVVDKTSRTPQCSLPA